MSSQSVVITGSNSGFGLLATRTLLAKGHRVVATMRDPGVRNAGIASDLESAGAHIVEIDVTNEDSVNAGVSSAVESLGHVDALVNNAGVGTLGLQEAFTIADWQRVFDINVFGVQRMNRAVLPHMRERGAGLLVHVSSLLGRFVLPFFGPYNATKWALEAMAENYRVELSALGIESTLVEPGGYGTDFTARLIPPSDADRGSGYGELAGAPGAMLSNFEKAYQGADAPDPQTVADAIVGLIEAPAGSRPFRTVVDALGMGIAIKDLNDASEQTMRGIYKSIGMSKMLGEG